MQAQPCCSRILAWERAASQSSLSCIVSRPGADVIDAIRVQSITCSCTLDQQPGWNACKSVSVKAKSTLAVRQGMACSAAADMNSDDLVSCRPCASGSTEAVLCCCSKEAEWSALDTNQAGTIVNAGDNMVTWGSKHELKPGPLASSSSHALVLRCCLAAARRRSGLPWTPTRLGPSCTQATMTGS